MQGCHGPSCCTVVSLMVRLIVRDDCDRSENDAAGRCGNQDERTSVLWLRHAVCRPPVLEAQDRHWFIRIYLIYQCSCSYRSDSYVLI
jgi:hypothetical protein